MLRVYEPFFTEEDAKAVYDAVRSGMVSSLGPAVEQLESAFAKYCGRKHAITASNGSVALVLAITGLKLKNERIAVPASTFAAVASSVLNTCNRLEVIDVETSGWNMDLDLLEDRCNEARRNGDPIRCVIAVHNYGNPIDFNRLRRQANTYGFYIIEDACEAMGAEFCGKKTGSFGDVSIFSLYANKTITSGEGGIILTDDDEIAYTIRLYRGQGQDPNRKFWHLVPGFNYRMTNIQAALALSQFKRIDEIMKCKERVANEYKAHLPAHARIQQELPNAKHCWWMFSIVSNELDYEFMANVLAERGIETRPIFPSLTQMPAFAHLGYRCPNAEWLHAHGITLPSGPNTSDKDIRYICDVIQ
ncbi:MAG: DegT/DnrJ/EryC1/StrS family aminotransferase [Nitrososphaerales archaeon]